MTRQNRRFLRPNMPYNRVLAEQSGPKDIVNVNDTESTVKEGGVYLGNDSL